MSEPAMLAHPDKLAGGTPIHCNLCDKPAGRGLGHLVSIADGAGCLVLHASPCAETMIVKMGGEGGAHVMFCASCNEATATIVHTGGRDLCPECAGQPKRANLSALRDLVTWLEMAGHVGGTVTALDAIDEIEASRAARVALEKKLADVEAMIARTRAACHLMDDRDGPLDEVLPRAIGWEPTAHGLAHPLPDGRPSEWSTAYGRELAAHNETRQRLENVERDLATYRAADREGKSSW